MPGGPERDPGILAAVCVDNIELCRRAYGPGVALAFELGIVDPLALADYSRVEGSAAPGDKIPVIVDAGEVCGWLDKRGWIRLARNICVDPARGWKLFYSIFAGAAPRFEYISAPVAWYIASMNAYAAAVAAGLAEAFGSAVVATLPHAYVGISLRFYSTGVEITQIPSDVVEHVFAPFTRRARRILRRRVSAGCVILDGVPIFRDEECPVQMFKDVVYAAERLDENRVRLRSPDVELILDDKFFERLEAEYKRFEEG